MLIHRAPLVGVVAGGTALGLAGIAALHAAWGRGSSFPFSEREQLTETVVGGDVTPSPAACFAVAGALGTAAALVARAGSGGRTLSRAGALGVAAVLVGRATVGFAGRTDLVSPGSVGERFRRLDRRVLSPLCLALGSGAATAALSRRSR